MYAFSAVMGASGQSCHLAKTCKFCLLLLQLRCSGTALPFLCWCCRQAALLTIGGLDLEPLLGRGGLDGIMNWEGDKQEMRRAAAALGYLASVVERLGFYLDVPLRYPIKLGNCKSVILGHAAAAGSFR